MFIMQQLSFTLKCIFQETQIKRIVQSSDDHRTNSCPACPLNDQIRVNGCSLLTYVCEKMTEAREHGLRVYIYGASGTGKTRAVNCHFNEERIFLPSSCNTFSFDGFDARLHSCVFFDEFDVSNSHTIIKIINQSIYIKCVLFFSNAII